MVKEIWKDIPEYEGIYQASNLGEIRTHPNKTTYTKRHGIRKWKCRILKGRGDFYATGRRVNLWKNGKHKDWLVARLVAITFLGYPVGDKNTVNHINGNRLDNRIENLEWTTLGDNVRHAFRTGLMPTHHMALVDIITNEIYYCYSEAEACRFLNKNHSYITTLRKRERRKNKELCELKDNQGRIYHIIYPVL